MWTTVLGTKYQIGIGQFVRNTIQKRTNSDVSVILYFLIITDNSFEAILAIKKLYNEGYATTLTEGLKLEEAADSRLTSTGDQIAQFEQKKFKN